MTEEVVGQVRIHRIVAEDDPKALVEDAWKLAGRMRQKDSVKTQIRRLLGVMRQIEMIWPRRVKTSEERRQEAEARRQLLLFKPRLAYQVSRNHNLEPLEKVLQRGIDLVDNREQFQRLLQFFEATVAYYVAGEGERQPGAGANRPAKPGSRKPGAEPQGRLGR